MKKLRKKLISCVPILALSVFFSQPISAEEPVSDQTAPAIYVSNAGLALIGVYYWAYFERLGLVVTDDWTESIEDQDKAVCMLQLLVSGECVTDESSLALNKILIGMEPSETVRTDNAASLEETQLAESLLNSVIANWPAMGEISPANFQEAFLARNGTLIEDSHGWTLTVERKPLDVLLDQIPWNYSVFHYGWMNKPLYVIW